MVMLSRQWIATRRFWEALCTDADLQLKDINKYILDVATIIIKSAGA